MSFKAYDILSSLIPGFLMLLLLLKLGEIPFDKDMVVPYTAIAFLLGNVMNTLSSWLEDFYFFTWGGKPSLRLLEGEGIWKVRFYHCEKAKALLLAEARPNACHDELFSIAMRYANAQKDPRVEDFNTAYAFARVLLTTVLIGTVVLIGRNYFDWRYYAILTPILFIVWLRCKQRNYYYTREVLNVYLKVKNC
ncbi:hypothetical protein I2I11_20760 [Pontibacter sp. 172403-2]|uniref:hypothetical protein n=1 Tax=Pontibacter rufus TaxID=2791028 RepID=UPI0018B00142|nr:hypothetical protein [Pontibacter sp. 172403-2]MBF9255742.1 hypothetical protein [Pontibacter sp. 172403-2]